LTSEYQADFSIAAAWRHPPICRLLVIKTAALISQNRRIGMIPWHGYNTCPAAVFSFLPLGRYFSDY